MKHPDDAILIGIMITIAVLIVSAIGFLLFKKGTAAIGCLLVAAFAWILIAPPKRRR